MVETVIPVLIFLFLEYQSRAVFLKKPTLIQEELKNCAPIIPKSPNGADFLICNRYKLGNDLAGAMEGGKKGIIRKPLSLVHGVWSSWALGCNFPVTLTPADS